MVDIRRYVTAAGKDVIGEWLTNLQDGRAQARLAARIDRLSAGNFGDCKPLRQGLWELRIDWGPGYRVYYAMLANARVLLLCGGHKRRQSSDIERALAYLANYKERTAKHETQS